MLEDDGAVHAPISQEPGTGFDPATSPVPRVLAPALAWRGPHAALAAGASFSHRAQGGGIWPGGGAMPVHHHQGRPCGRHPAALRLGDDTPVTGVPASPSRQGEPEQPGHWTASHGLVP
jgi:hypothetical protein